MNTDKTAQWNRDFSTWQQSMSYEALQSFQNAKKEANVQK